MSRIRSIHPALFTDDGFMELSMPARLLLIGIWCESDDSGAFEWKPKVLKARVFPGDSVDAEPLLAELVAQNFVQPYEVDGRRYGAVRNFCRFQRPRKPKARYPLPEKFRTFVASDAASSAEPDDDDIEVPQKSEPVRTKSEPVPPKSEIAPQMEDGDGVGEGSRSDSSASLRNRAAQPTRERARAGQDDLLADLLRGAAGYDRATHRAAGLDDVSPIRRLLAAGLSLDEDILPAIERRARTMPGAAKTWAYFEGAILEHHAARTRPVVVPDPPAATGPPRGASAIDQANERQRALIAKLQAQGDAA